MAAYLIAHFRIEDADGYAAYGQGVLPLIQKYEGRLLVADDAATVLEGNHPEGRVVVVEFPSLAIAREWRSSDEYEKLNRIRQSSTETFSLVLVDGFVPPPL